MPVTRMVPLVAVPSEFAGRVLVAKLGSAGILAELRDVSRIYPSVLGEPVVWVEEQELSDARALVAADTDDVLAADAPDPDGPPLALLSGRRGTLRPIIVAVAIVLMASLAFSARSCSPSAGQSSARVP
jgi:hypothetical protein